MAKILVIEDNIEVLNSISYMLENMKHQVLSASTGEYALDIIEQVPIELVITDIKLKGRLSGLDIIKLLSNPRIKLLAISGFKPFLKKAQNLKVPTLSKPFKADDLISTINNLLA